MRLVPYPAGCGVSMCDSSEHARTAAAKLSLTCCCLSHGMNARYRGALPARTSERCGSGGVEAWIGFLVYILFRPEIQPFSPPPPSSYSLSVMDPTAASKSFVPLFDTVPSRRPAGATLSASIWAPQPQPSETTWSKAIDSINRVNDDFKIDVSFRPEMRRAVSHPAGRIGEDVFGPVGLVPNRKKDIGAIGDGRKKASPDHETVHVQQLLRTLNLNSPAPPLSTSGYGGMTSASASPDVSPVSTTSGLHTPPDVSPAKAFGEWKLNPSYDFGPFYQTQPSEGLLFQTSPLRHYDILSPPSGIPLRSSHSADSFPSETKGFVSLQSFPDCTSGASTSALFTQTDCPPHAHQDVLFSSSQSAPWSHQRLRSSSAEWLKPEDRRVADSGSSPINFLSLLHPSSTPPYPLFVARIIKSSDQQASIFLQQKLKVADAEERAKIVDAICARGFEMMAHRFGNWAVQRCLEATSSVDERRKIVSCMRSRVVELATNCYGCHVLQKALDCEEEIRLVIVTELLLGDPAQTLVNKHASHVWSKIMELSWTPPAPPIFAYVNKSLKGKWASLACHETGSLVVQHAFENLEESAKDGIVDELLNQGSAVFGEVAKSQWGSYCIQHILEHGSSKYRGITLDHLVSGLLEYATNEHGSKSVTKALKEGGKETLDRVITRMCEPAKDLALSATGSQLIASVLPHADKDQRALLYDSIRGHIVTLRGCKTGSKVIWLFDRMVRIPSFEARSLSSEDTISPQRAYYGY
ncbi:hypothetical protein NM688_g4071 [Phlebia brevispora]|uniref:Uncharacterized protein n=1 Tax=Phlebia brevispora TaxID=194682 RepID=A0ACC1T3X3_9APHY|nr:hypothetical protein NM688_g4071 [Phlebia brevispora]